MVAVCIIEALKSENRVSVLSWEPADFDAINTLFASSLGLSEFTSLSAPRLLRVLAKFNPYVLSFTQGIIQRMCKKMRNNYDVIISANNEADFGCKGIQYLHEPPYWVPQLYGRPYPDKSLFSQHNLWALFKGERRPWMLISGFSYDRMKENLTLVNSNWTGTRLKEIYGLESTTVYPPVLGDFPEIPWERRENGLVCIGRIVPSKNLEKLVEITAHVRRTVPEAHLHIIGTTDESPAYVKHIRHLGKDASWISLNENVTRKELEQLVTSHRYGIHGMVNEPFGIAVAEMIHAGCITFVPRSGGPREIIGEDDRLLYGTIGEAVTKITHVMQSSDEQSSLRDYLSSRRDLFSKNHFISQIQQIVEEFLDHEGLTRERRH